MAGRRAGRDAISRAQWAARIGADAVPAGDDVVAPRARGARLSRNGDPLSAERIVSAALDVVQSVGYDALTMRAVAAALGTGAASLYAHVRSKAELGDLLIGELCSRIVLPSPGPESWRDDFLDVCGQLRDGFLAYPGVAQATLAVVPADLATLRVSEGMLGILLAGGVAPQEAAWVCDSAILYVTAYCLEAATAQRQSEDVEGRAVGRDEIAERLRMLPPGRFPLTVAHARELTTGGGHARFDFALGLMLRGLG